MAAASSIRPTAASRPEGASRPRSARPTLAAALCLTGVLAVTACSGGGADGGASGADSGGGKTAKVYVVAPLTGPASGGGKGMRNAVELAVRQAKAAGRTPGWDVQVVPLDDKGDPAEAGKMAAKAAQDADTVAVVGSVYSGLTKAMMPALDKAGVLHVSPSATNPTLTHGTDPKKPARQSATFFRVVPTDDAHGPAIATYLREQGIRSVVTVHDRDSYGQGLVEAFTPAWKKAGGQVKGAVSLPATPTTAQVDGVVAAITKAKPQAVMFGGTDLLGGRIAGQVRRAGLVVPVAGGDAVHTGEYIPRSGPVSAGDVATAAGEDAASTKVGKAFLAAYDQGGFVDGMGQYGTLGYDAGSVVVTALASALPSASDASSARAATLKAAASTRIDGVGGPIAFDEYGDIATKIVRVDVLSGGRWTPTKVYRFDH